MSAVDATKRVPVSVIIPCYQCSDTIDLAVQSVINQSAMPGEICLIDDGSGDDGRTKRALHSLKERYDSVIKTHIILQKENKGPGSARNAGWDMASQPYVAFLDADDAWHPQKLELIHRILEKNPLIDLIGHDFYMRDEREGGQVYSAEKNGYVVRKKSYISILLINPFVTPSFVLKKSISQRFNPNLRYCEDHEFLLRVSHTYHVAHAKLKLVQLGREPFAEGGLTAMRTRMRLGEVTMYVEALKYRKGLVVWLPALILLSMVKHAALLGLSYVRRGKVVPS